MKVRITQAVSVPDQYEFIEVESDMKVGRAASLLRLASSLANPATESIGRTGPFERSKAFESTVGSPAGNSSLSEPVRPLLTYNDQGRIEY